MTSERRRKRPSSSYTVRYFLTASALFSIGTGCGSAPDAKFSAETYDEYTEPLTNATIVEGEKVTVIGPEGAAAEGVTAAPLTSGGGVGPFPDGGVGPFPDGGVGASGPSGFWHFDDWSPKSNFLIDSSGNNFSAQHALKSTCVAGISGLGVKFAKQKDIVQVPDEPEFTVDQRIAVAAWINPDTVAGDQPIVLKRQNAKTAFSLGIHKGNVEMSIQLANNHTFISRAPVVAKKWTHVAGMYDGRFLFLFIDGEQFGQVFVGSALRNVFAPIRIGATTETQSFKGVIDDVWVSTNAVSKEELTALSCIRRPATLAVSPATSGPVAAGTTVPYTVAVTNNDVGACSPQSYFFQFTDFFPGDGGGGTTVTTSTTGGVTVGTGPTGPSTGSVGTSTSSVATGGGSRPFPVSDGGFAGNGSGGSGGAPPSDGGFGGGFAGAGVGGSFGSAGGGAGTPSNAGIAADVNPQFISDIQSGMTANFFATVTGSEDADPGVHHLPFNIFSFSSGDSLSGELVYELTEPTGCFVRTRRELMITTTSVVDDPIRTAFDVAPGTPGRGVWTFGRLMRDLAPTPEEAPALTERMFQTWLTNQTVNGFTIQARPAIQQVVLDNWPRLPDGSLNLDRSPLRLLAIVNRLDLRNVAQGNAGEGRFVFGVIGPFGSPEQFTVILEYKLPAANAADVQTWANLWHGLSSHPFPSEEYNAALEAVTLRFSGRGAAPGRVNGSALSQLRTNEISLVPRWELREFALSSETGSLEPTTIKLTPDLGFNGTPTLADFVNQNQASIIAETHTVPETFQGAPFLTGSVFNDLIRWSAPGIIDNDARFHFSINTCNGCHGPEANTTFLQISPRFPGQEAPLSPFLMGTSVFDPFSGQVRSLNDLARRNTDLRGIVCGPSSAVAVPSLMKGVQRAD